LNNDNNEDEGERLEKIKAYTTISIILFYLIEKIIEKEAFLGFYAN